jgi:regulator of RNase E activity RraB
MVRPLRARFESTGRAAFGERRDGMADWSSYFARVEGEPISVAVDLALREGAPDSGKPAAYTIAVTLREPDAHGMTGASEYRALQRIEEELAAALEPAGLVEAGRVTGRGMRTFHYYGPESNAVARRVADVMSAHKQYTYSLLAANDPLWAVYNNYLYPDAQQMAFANDMKALQVLIDAGDDLEKRRPIEHTVAFDDKEKCETFARAMADRGYRVAIDRSDNTVRCAKLDTVDPFKITEMRVALTALAEEFGGEYSGWSTAVQS